MESLMTEKNVDEQRLDDAAVEKDLPVLISSVGEQLRGAREKCGMSLADLAQTLKLGIRQIEALENGDWNVLPGPTFIRGFVRNYARAIGIDHAALMTQLDQVIAKPASVLSVPETAPANVSYSSSGGRDDRRVVLVGLFAALLAALVYFLLPDDLAELRQQTQSLIDSLSRKDEPPAVAAPAAVPQSSEPVFPPGTTPQQIMNPQSVTPLEQLAPASAQPGAPAEKQVDGASTSTLSFEIVRESWIEVKDRDGQVILSQRLLAGSQKVLSGNGPLTLHIGYAPGVKMQWRGQVVDLEPHTRGDVARLVLE
jgi:cytoskeleton protein RodZ